MNGITIPRVGLAAIVAASLAGCTQVEKLPLGDAGGEIPPEVQRVFDAHCAIAGCHDNASSAGSLDLSPAGSGAIIGGPSERSTLPMVAIGSVDGSFLAQKILPAPLPGDAGGPMPPGSAADPQVLADDLGIVIAWIAGLDIDDGGVADGSGDGMDDGGEGMACSINAVAPGTANPIVSGTMAGELPATIGTALAANCGCHYNSSQDDGFRYTGNVGMATHADFQATWAGADPNFAGLAAYEGIVARMLNDSMPPSSYCQLPGDIAISGADKTRLQDWMIAGAPDAPTWAGMGG